MFTSPLTNLGEVKRFAQRSRETFSTDDMSAALKRISDEGPYWDLRKIAEVGLEAMDSVEQLQRPDELKSMSLQATADAGLRPLTLLGPDEGALNGVSRTGYDLTVGTKLLEPNLTAAETVMRYVLGAGVPGPLGATLELALDIGEAVRAAGTGGTSHGGAISCKVLNEQDELVPGARLIEGAADFDFPGLAGVYNAAFNYADRKVEVDAPGSLAGLGSLMLRIADENIRRFQERGGCYTSPVETPKLVAGKVLDSLDRLELSDEQRAWVRMAHAAQPLDGEGDAVRLALDALSRDKPADAIGIMAVGRVVMNALPAEARDGFAAEVVTLARERLDPQGEHADLVAAALDKGLAEGIQHLEETTGDKWLGFGSRNPDLHGIMERPGSVSFGRTTLKRRRI
ncbi:MAG: hypothetical protein AB1758_16000 [Candidatus Eremiobacterota bacterium]